MTKEFERLPPEGLLLDGIRFDQGHHERESAHHNNQIIGEIDWEENKRHWQARSGDGSWILMRSRTEARAFVVSKYLCKRTLLPCWREPENVA